MTITIAEAEATTTDAGVLSNGRALSKPANWSNTGTNDVALWGEIKGSGKSPYQVRWSLGDRVAKCSCPSRIFPCKHAVALLILYAREGAAIPRAAEPPGWVAEWLAGREDRARKKEEKVAAKAAAPPPTAEELARQGAARAKTLARREDRIDSGLAELERWLHDLVRGGLASLRAQDFQEWRTAAARLVDSQAPALATRIQSIGEQRVGGLLKDEALLEQLGLVQLLIDGWRSRAQLSPDERADIEAQVGVPVSTQSVWVREGIADRWLVAGRESRELQGSLLQTTTWLRGLRTGLLGELIEVVSTRGAPADGSGAAAPFPGAVGLAFAGEIALYPGAGVPRVLVKQREGQFEPVRDWPGAGIAEALRSARLAAARNPWTTAVPALLRGVRLEVLQGEWVLHERGSGAVIPLDRSTPGLWEATAIAGMEEIGALVKLQRGPAQLLSVFIGGEALQPGVLALESA